MKLMQKAARVRSTLFMIFVVLLIFIQLYPAVFLILSSFKIESEFSMKPIFYLPAQLYFQNYVQAWTVGNMELYFRNSILTTFPALILIIGFGAAAAFAIEKMVWKARNFVLFVFLGGIMVPAQIVLIPLFSIYQYTGVLNTLWSLIFTYTAFGLPLTVLLFSGYFKSVPREVIESGVMDGASIYVVFFKIASPMIANSIITVLMIQFLFWWNELLFSMTFINDNNLKTIQTGLLYFTGQWGQREWGPTFASISLSVLPTLVLYLFMNKMIIRGMTGGAVKG